MVKLAMIGAGGYAYELIKRIWQIPEQINLVAVTSSPARQSAGKKACIEKGVKVYDTPEQLLEGLQGKVDAIFVPTPINTHFALSKKCIDAGFDVLLEKPPVATIQELDQLITFARDKGKRVAVAFQCLYTTIVNEIKIRIVAGEFGRILRVRGMAGWVRLDSYFSRSVWAGKLKVNGDWVLDGTINNPLAHMLANELYFASMQSGKMAEPVSVQAELYHGHDIESEDTSSVRIVTEDDVEVLFNASLCVKDRIDVETVVECEKATVHYVNFDSARIVFGDGRSENIEDKSEQRVYMLSRLAQCLETGDRFDAPLEMCRPFTVCVNGAFDSCGQPVGIPAKYISRTEDSESIKTVVKGLDDAIKTAHTQGKLFSEIGVPWARKSRKISLTGYNHFPQDQ